MKNADNKNLDVALRQIRRLKGKGFYPIADLEDGKRINHGERELARTLHSYAESDEHMGRIIDAAIIQRFGSNGEDRCPTPSDIWVLCGEINPIKPAARVINPNCPECEGQGYMIVKGAHGRTGAAPCSRGCGVPEYQTAKDVLSRKAVGDWFEGELTSAVDRRDTFLKNRKVPTRKITNADIDALRARQNTRRLYPAEGAKSEESNQ